MPSKPCPFKAAPNDNDADVVEIPDGELVGLGPQALLDLMDGKLEMARVRAVYINRAGRDEFEVFMGAVIKRLGACDEPYTSAYRHWVVFRDAGLLVMNRRSFAEAPADDTADWPDARHGQWQPFPFTTQRDVAMAERLKSA